MIIQIRMDGLWIKPPILLKTHKNVQIIHAAKHMDGVLKAIDGGTNVSAQELTMSRELMSGHNVILGAFLEIVGIHGGRHSDEGGPRKKLKAAAPSEFLCRPFRSAYPNIPSSFKLPAYPFLPSLPPMAFFTPVKFLNKFEVRVGNTKYLYTIRPTASSLYELRDRESDPDYDADENWSFRAWCGAPATNEEHLRAFREAAAGRQKVDGDCLICMEPFNLSDHKAVTCPYCETAYCRTCIQTCLLQDTVAQCQEPACRKSWTDEFLRGTMTKVFMMGPYKAHREKLLIDQERARLPESQQDAQRYRNACELVKPITVKINMLDDKIKELPSYIAYHALRDKNDKRWENPEYVKMTTLQRQVYLDTMRNEEASLKKNLDNDARPFRKEISTLRSDAYTIALGIVDAYGKDEGARQTTHAEANKSKWTFTMRCPAAECEGFVGLDWVCGMCTQTVCKDCRECVGSGDSPHVCDDAKVASVKALAKEAKPCPKCAAMISKIDGCDQMWCTQCHTAFSWRTGNVETYIHNPHYYQWMRQTGQHLAPVPRAQQLGADAPCMTAEQICARATRIPGLAAHPTLASWIQRTYHVLTTIVHGFTLDIQTEDTRVGESKRILRVRRLVKEIDDAEWGAKLQQFERTSNRKRRLYHVYDMFKMTVADLIRPIVDRAHIESDFAETLVGSLQSLGAYVDNELRKIKREFNMSNVYFVTPWSEREVH